MKSLKEQVSQQVNEAKRLKLYVVEMDYREVVVVAPAGSTEEELLELMNSEYSVKDYYKKDEVRRINELSGYDVTGKPGIISSLTE
jgi:hypothetical protein